MKWNDYSSRCDKEVADHFGDVADLHQLAHQLHLIPDTLLDLENYTGDAVDDAVVHFSEHQVWPHLTPTERTMLAFRLEFGASLSFVLSHPSTGRPILIPEPSLDVPPEHVWRWLLIEAWHSHGFPSLHDTAERLLRGGRRASGVDSSVP